MSVREHRIATNWAEGIKDMVDIMYPDAKKIVFVMDNLNIHKAVFLYKRYLGGSKTYHEKAGDPLCTKAWETEYIGSESQLAFQNQ